MPVQKSAFLRDRQHVPAPKLIELIRRSRKTATEQPAR